MKGLVLVEHFIVMAAKQETTVRDRLNQFANKWSNFIFFPLTLRVFCTKPNWVLITAFSQQTIEN